MAPGDRRRPALSSPPPLPPLLLLLLCAVTSSLFSTGLCSGGEEFSVCNTECCTVEPSCATALHVTCSCHDEPLIAIRRGDLPDSVTSIYISKVKEVVIYENALLDLTSLVEVKFKMIGSLTVQSNGLNLQKSASLYSFNVDTVKKLELDSSAFSGFWERGTKIEIGYITENMYIRQNAFSFQTLSRPPSLVIKAAKFLAMDSMAFNAPFRSLTLIAVNTKLCKRNTFSGTISRIEMKNVNITELDEECINGTGDLEGLSISDSNMEIIKPRGIYGEIQEVKIENSAVGEVQPNGFQLLVDKLRIHKSKFGHLMTSGLNVRATNSIYFSNASVHEMQRHALIALKVDNGSPMCINDLNVSLAETGSLTLDKAVSLELIRLSVRPPKHPVCPMDRWVRFLTGTDESEPLSDTGQQILTELSRNWLCREGKHAATTPQMTTDDPVRGTEQASTVKPRTQDYDDQTPEEHDRFDMDQGAVTIMVLVVLIGLSIGIVCLMMKWSQSPEPMSGTGEEQRRSSGAAPSRSPGDAYIQVDSASKGGVRKRKRKPDGSKESRRSRGLE